MKIYDFSYYLKRKEAQRAALLVSETVSNINQPGAVIQLKRHVTTCLLLQKEVVNYRL